MSENPGVALLTKLCIVSFLGTLILLAAASVSNHGGEITYTYFAFLAFAFLSLPLHLVGIALTIYTGVKSKNHKARTWQYAYFGSWLAINAMIFSPFLFQQVPELVGKALYSMTHKAEIELTRTLNQHEQNPAKVKELIDGGVDVHQVDRYIGFPPIVWAARQGNAEVVSMLVEAGADVHIVIERNANTGVLNELFVPEVTPLGFASVTQDDAQRLVVVQQLLGYGVDPNRGHAVLGTCAFGDVATLKALLVAGADPDIEDLNGLTCAHAAAYNGRLEMLAYLLEHDYALDSRDKHSRTPLDTAISRYQEDAVLMLLRQGLRPGSGDALERFLNQEPANTEVKTEIREFLLAVQNGG